MSDTDSFIREVTEEVRQDRMFRLWKKYGVYVIGAIAGIVAATAAWNWMQQQEVAARLERGAAFLEAEAGDVAAQEQLFAGSEGAAKALAGLRLAAARAAGGDAEGAAQAYDQVASLPDVGRQYTDYAALEALRLRAAAADPKATIEGLEPLVAPDAPYRLLALELRAAMLLNAGETAAARGDLETIIADPGATGELLARAEAVLATLGAGGSDS